jgi:hypothetical protein
MIEPIRISAEEARQKATSEKALLVCDYDDELKYKRVHLEGEISFLAEYILPMLF